MKSTHFPSPPLSSLPSISFYPFTNDFTISILQTLMELTTMAASLFIENLSCTRHHGSRIMIMLKQERKWTLTECLLCIRHWARLFPYIILQSWQQPRTMNIVSPIQQGRIWDYERAGGVPEITQIEMGKWILSAPQPVSFSCSLLAQSKPTVLNMQGVSIQWRAWVNMLGYKLTLLSWVTLHL